MEKLVSVIVPIYNVAQYLPECIDSVRNQTYKNMQIVLVNDGSTDNSLDICLKYQNEDDRIVIINKKNGGLSSARNEGIKAANGDYLSFVDSDDFIDCRMIENLVHLLESTESDISCCNYDIYNEKSEFVKRLKTDVISSEVYSMQRALELLLSDKYFKCFAWNKLFKRSLFHTVKFPEGKLYEDIWTIYTLIKHSKRVVFCGNAMYHYRARKGSITQRRFDKRVYEMLEPIRIIKEECLDNKKILMGCAAYYLFFIDDMILAGQWDEKVYEEYLEIFLNTGDYFRTDSIYGRTRKIQMKLCANNIGIYKYLYRKVRSLKTWR